MGRYPKLVGALATLLASAIVVAPTPAVAGCPGCEEYTLDIPSDDGGSDEPAPAPAPPAAAPAPAAPAPAAPAATTTTPATTVPVAPVPVAEPKSEPKPVDRDPDPVPDRAKIEPSKLASVPAVAAAQAQRSSPATGGATGIWPLALGMAGIALVAALLAIRGRRAPAASAGEDRASS